MPHAVSQGVFLTVEGIEGAGKSTALKYIQDYLTKAKIHFILTREPGGTKIAEAIRKILLTIDVEEVITAPAELLLMFAARSQHIEHVILPALQMGKWVVSDRFVDASFAYQGGGRQIDLSYIKMLDNWIVGRVKPDKTILLDVPPAVGLMRAKHRGEHDRIESEKVEFFERVRNAYLERAKEENQRFFIIDATQSLETVQNELKKLLDEWV